MKRKILNYNKGQSTLEVSMIVGVLFFFLLGIVRIVGWFNADMVNRQTAYKLSRIEATRRLDLAAKGVPYQTPALDIFGVAEDTEIDIDPAEWASYAERDGQLQQEIEAIQEEGQAIIERFYELKDTLIPEHQQAARRESQIAQGLALQGSFIEARKHRQAAREHWQKAATYQAELDNIPNRLAALEQRITEAKEEDKQT